MKTQQVVIMAGALIVSVFLALAVAGAEEYTGKVVEVIDGDTLHVDHDGKVDSIRLAGIDAPNWLNPSDPKPRSS